MMRKTCGTAIRKFDIDVMGNLRSVTLPDSTQIRYLIDGANRRIGKLRNNVLEKSWLWQSQLRPAAQLDIAGNAQQFYLYGEKVNVPSYLVNRENGVNVTYRVISDHLGSVRLVVNADTGVVAQRLRYDEFGVVLEDTNPWVQPFGCAGGFYDADTGLVRFGARNYDSGVGRWLIKDAAGFSGGLNTYGYVSSDPINKLDLNGEAEVCSRALDGAAGVKVGDVRHDQIWYDDGGESSGFFGDDRVRADYIDPENPSAGERSKDEYGNCKYIGSDADTRAAEERVKKTMDMDWTALNNCQGYVDKVTNDTQLTDARIKPVGEAYTRKKP